MSRHAPPALVLVAFFAAAALYFAAHQSIWVDETTQLSGLALPFGTQFAWLAGWVTPPIGVPPDRMPPLSYWLGDLWAGAFGLSEMSMRMFGITATLCGAPAIWIAARRIAGPGAALFALGAVFLSSGLIVQAGEIRAYPLFFAFSSWALLAYVSVLQDPSGRRPGPLVALALLFLAATYTHFFGVVLAGALGLGLLAAIVIRRRPLLPPLVAMLGYLAGAAGISIFVHAALMVSGSAPQPHPNIALKQLAAETAKLGFHTLAGSSAFLYPALPVLMFVAAVALFVLAVLAGRRRIANGEPGLLPYLVLPAVAAFVILPLLRLKIQSFNVLSSNYNMWLVPLVALILASAFAERERLAWVFGGVFLLAVFASDVLLLAHPTLFTHGPGEWLAAKIGSPERTLVVHDETGSWGQAYFPLFFLTRGKVTQVLLSPQGTEQLIKPGGLVSVPAWPSDRFDRIIYVKTTDTSTAGLAKSLATGCEPPKPRVLPAPFPEKTSTSAYCAFSSAVAVVVTRSN